MNVSSFSPPRSLVISVVSHGHGPLVQALLHDLARFSAITVQRVVLTQNLPEAEPQAPAMGWPFVFQIVKNFTPAGFGANHNRALSGAAESLVCVLNPDIRLGGSDPFAALAQAAAQVGVGCAYPVQLDEQGRLQDSERELPTPWTLWRRRMLGRCETRVDWVNAACMVLPQPVWRAVGGFDETYFMYCEDVDLCLRIRLTGRALVRAPAQVVHAGQRASHKRWSHLQWHVRSLLRLWRSPAYAQARHLLRGDVTRAGTIGRS
ncbi:glycosyltransferase [Acidovorax sp.]|uniref:glycosyltransferase family 2 protein n=1 Tax=Acidovorax sp. TaxID=1872122 RepID=UPI0026352E5C|nr:glycosyltransferase [Acidovorax sp.]